MAIKASKSPLDKVLGRLDDLDQVNLGILVQRLARERKLLETVFGVIRDGILVLDEEGILSYSNRQGRLIIGLKEEQTGKVSLLRRGSRDCPGTRFGSQLKTILGRSCSKGNENLLSRTPACPNLRGSHRGQFRQDEGRKVRSNDSYHRRDRGKVNLEARLESERVSSIMDLAAGVAHELGNPLNSIHIHLQVLQRSLKDCSEITDKSKKSLSTCLKEVERLDGIISHFLKAIRPTTPDFKKIKLLDVIEETVRLKEREVSAKNINIRMEAGVREPFVNGDAEQLKQAFFNIIGNAIDAVAENSEIRIITGIDSDHVFAQVIDQGAGIRKEDLPHVFEPYFTTKKEGHGIGMMIVHRIVRDHGGDVGIDSKQDAGTIVTLRFPRKSPRHRLLESNELQEDN